MRTSHLFTIFFLFLNLLILAKSSDIIVKSAIYLTTCNTTLDEAVFKLTYERAQGHSSPIPEFTIEMILENKEENNTIETKCIHDESGQVFECSFTPEVLGTYHPYLSNDIPIEEGNEVLKAFELIDDKIGWNEHYVPPKKDKYLENAYFKEGEQTTYYLQFNFTSELEEDGKPGLLLNNNIIECSINDLNNKSIICPITMEMFPITNISYHGFLLTACGTKEGEVEVMVNEKPDLFYIEKVDVTKEDATCASLRNDSEIELNFTCTEKYFVGDGYYSIDNQIQFVNSEDESIEIPTKCVLNNKTFVCFAIEDAPINGTYYATLKQNYEVKRQQGDFIIKAFKSSNIVYINQNYVEPADKTQYFYFNYADIGGKTIVIRHKKKLIEIPPLFVNNKELKCEMIYEYQECFVDKMTLPAINGHEYYKYNGTLMNLCGNEEYKIWVSVKDTSPYTEINLTKAIFDYPLISTKKELTFKVEMETQGKVEKGIELNNLTLVSEDVIYDLECHNEFGDNFFTCTAKDLEAGVYNVVLEDVYRFETYNIHNYTSHEVITVEKDYTKPISDKIEQTHDYSKQGDKGVIKIQFQDPLGEYTPKVNMEGINLNCSKDNDFLNCDFYRRDFPTSKITEWYGFVYNTLNLVEAKINLTVTCNGAGYLAFRFAILVLGFLFLI